MAPNDFHEDEQELNIENIIREFSEPETELDDFLRQFASELFHSKMAAPPAEEDTIRLDLPVKPEPAAPAATPEPQPQSETIVWETARFTPLAPKTEPEATQDADSDTMPPLEVETEPFSEGWEPEYEAPMGEFTPQEPIPFPPKNRTRLLREKLAAGPEKRFQDLSAAGFGGLSAGIFLQTFLFVFSALSTVLLHMDKVNPAQLQPMRFCQLVIILLSGLLGCYRLLSGMGSLLRGKFTTNTLLCVAFLACTVDAYLCLKYGRIAMSALFSLHMLMAQLAAYQQRLTEMSQMDTLRKARDLTAVVKINEFYNGQPGYTSMPGEPESFMAHYAATPAPEKALWNHSLLVLIVSLVLAVVAGIRLWLEPAIQTFCAALLLGLPATAHISMTRPACIAGKRLHSLGAVLCGWHGIRYAEKNGVYPLQGEDLFPVSGIKMNGAKFCGTTDPGWVTVCATALIAANESGMQEIFLQLPRGRDGLNQTVEDLQVYSGGISGLVSGVPAMVGTAEFMDQMGVALPESARIADAVYAAVDGELGGIFVVNYPSDKASVAGLRNLTSWRSLKPIWISDDFLLTPRFIREKLGVKLQRVEFPASEVRQVLRTIAPEDTEQVVALTTKPGLAAKTYALNSAWALRSAQSFGANIHTLGGLIGLMLVGLLSFIGAYELLEPTNLLLFTLVWMLPGFLATEGARHF